MLPDMFCSADDCACRPDTAVFNASKIPMTYLQLVHWPDDADVAGGRRRTPLQQVTCQEFFRMNSAPYCFDPAGASGQICRGPAEIAGSARRADSAPALVSAKTACLISPRHRRSHPSRNSCVSKALAL